jgi:hypothetical protein
MRRRYRRGGSDYDSGRPLRHRPQSCSAHLGHDGHLLAKLHVDSLLYPDVMGDQPCHIGCPFSGPPIDLAPIQAISLYHDLQGAFRTQWRVELRQQSKQDVDRYIRCARNGAVQWGKRKDLRRWLEYFSTRYYGHWCHNWFYWPYVRHHYPNRKLRKGAANSRSNGHVHHCVGGQVDRADDAQRVNMCSIR